MTRLYLPIITLLFLSLTYAYQQIPLSKREYGFSVGDKQGDLHLQFFLDFLCDDSKRSYESMTQVMDRIDFYQQGIKFTYQFSPLSWHFYSFKITQAFFFVWQKVGAQQAQRFIAYVLSHQQDFSEQKWVEKKVSQFLDFFVQRISGVIKIDKAQFRSQLNSGESWNTARQHWKYAVGTHAVSATPTFNMNSVRVDSAQDFSADQWIDFLDKFKKVKTPKHLTADTFYLEMVKGKDKN